MSIRDWAARRWDARNGQPDPDLARADQRVREAYERLQTALAGLRADQEVLDLVDHFAGSVLALGTLRAVAFPETVDQARLLE